MAAQDIKNTHSEALANLAGGRLTSVDFVLDYLILGFDQNGALTTLVWPQIRAAGQTWSYGTSGYRDVLCDFITCVVQTALSDDHDALTIRFTDGRELFIPLSTYAGKGERAVLTGPRHFLMVF